MIALARRRTVSRATPTAPRLSHPHPTIAPATTGGASVTISRFAPGETRAAVAHRIPCESWAAALALYLAIERAICATLPEGSYAEGAPVPENPRGMARVRVAAEEGPKLRSVGFAIEDADDAPRVYSAAFATMGGGVK